VFELNYYYYNFYSLLIIVMHCWALVERWWQWWHWWMALSYIDKLFGWI